jgi:hypothetical protein
MAVFLLYQSLGHHPIPQPILAAQLNEMVHDFEASPDRDWPETNHSSDTVNTIENFLRLKNALPVIPHQGRNTEYHGSKDIHVTE